MTKATEKFNVERIKTEDLAKSEACLMRANKKTAIRSHCSFFRNAAFAGHSHPIAATKMILCDRGPTSAYRL